jgi:hypothetical protein
MTLILSGTNGLSDVDGDASTPAVRGTDANTGIFFPAADTIAFSEGGAEAMRINSSGQIGIGTTSFSRVLTVAGTSFNNCEITRYSNNAGGPNLFIQKSRGASVGTNTVVQNNDAAGNITFAAADGTDFIACASISAAIDGTPGTNDMPGRLVFSTTADGASSVTERARITSGGYFKASNDGTYLNSTGSYHEFRQTASDAGVLCTNTNASYASDGFFMRVSRAATSAYNFAVYQSVNGGNDTEFKLRGDGNGYADGTWNNNGADYAEFFESANGEALTLGATVVLDGNKVREATDQDPASSVIGVVRPKEPSKASMVIGNTAWNKWANKYLTDDFDRYIMEDHDVVEWEETITDEEGNTSTKQHSYESQAIPAGITVPADATRKTHDEKGVKFQHYKLNPAWDKDAEYVNRENRTEWNIIGLLGQVKILKGQPVGDRWIKMRDVSETVEEWMIR